MIVVYFFMTQTYIGTAIRAIAQDRQIMALMGVDTQAHLPHHLGAGRRAGRRWRPACWCCSTTSIPSSACRSGRSPS